MRNTPVLTRVALIAFATLSGPVAAQVPEPTTEDYVINLRDAEIRVLDRKSVV